MEGAYQIFGRDDFHTQRTDKHHSQCDSGADTVGTTAFTLGACGPNTEYLCGPKLTSR